ncbi:MAG TPA: DUF2269 family protein [Candidatus Limnocylindria bacterium]|jgi:uncharacterized membrane protein|nr:DUF2269 family protein [Candidatus Limnocylindria bacterium]
MLYLTIKFVHVVLVAVAIGANVTYGVWFAAAQSNPSFAPLALRRIKFIDDAIANPAYVLLLPTGAAMVALGHVGFGTRWVSWAMGLWVIAIVLAYGLYSPTLKAQIAAIDAEGPAGSSATALATRGQLVAGVLAVLVLAIVVLMVFKPT